MPSARRLWALLAIVALAGCASEPASPADVGTGMIASDTPHCVVDTGSTEAPTPDATAPDAGGTPADAGGTPVLQGAYR